MRRCRSSASLRPTCLRRSERRCSVLYWLDYVLLSSERGKYVGLDDADERHRRMPAATALVRDDRPDPGACARSVAACPGRKRGGRMRGASAASRRLRIGRVKRGSSLGRSRIIGMSSSLLSGILRVLKLGAAAWQTHQGASRRNLRRSPRGTRIVVQILRVVPRGHECRRPREASSFVTVFACESRSRWPYRSKDWRTLA